MRVKAKVLGYYGHKRRKPGEEFSINSKKDFSEKWMESLEKDSQVRGPAQKNK